MFVFILVGSIIAITMISVFVCFVLLLKQGRQLISILAEVKRIQLMLELERMDQSDRYSATMDKIERSKSVFQDVWKDPTFTLMQNSQHTKNMVLRLSEDLDMVKAKLDQTST